MDPDSIWESFYGGICGNIITGTNPVINVIDNQIFIFSSKFSDYVDRIISILDGSPRVLHSHCIFTRITSSLDGNIMKYEADGAVVQRNFDVTDSYTSADMNKYAHISISQLPLNSLNINYLSDCSALNCGHCDNANSMIFQRSGTCTFKNTNITNCKAHYNTMVVIQNSTTVARMSYCTGQLNNASSHGLFWMESDTTIDRCAFTNNSMTRDYRGLFISFNKTFITASTFFYNFGGALFSTGPTGKIILSKCVVDQFTVSGSLALETPFDSSLSNMNINFKPIEIQCSEFPFESSASIYLYLTMLDQIFLTYL